MSPGLYSFDFSRGTAKRTPRVVVTYNGYPIGEHAGAQEARIAIEALAKSLGTSLACFDVRPL
jgi:hypothetical protein